MDTDNDIFTFLIYMQAIGIIFFISRRLKRSSASSYSSSSFFFSTTNNEKKLTNQENNGHSEYNNEQTSSNAYRNSYIICDQQHNYDNDNRISTIGPILPLKSSTTSKQYNFSSSPSSLQHPPPSKTYSNDYNHAYPYFNHQQQQLNSNNYYNETDPTLYFQNYHHHHHHDRHASSSSTSSSSISSSSPTKPIVYHNHSHYYTRDPALAPHIPKYPAKKSQTHDIEVDPYNQIINKPNVHD